MVNGDFTTGLMQFLAGLALVVAGIFILFGGIPALVALIVGIVAGLVITIYRYGDELKQKLDNFSNWLFGIIDKDWRNIFGPMLGSVMNEGVSIVKSLIDGCKLYLSGLVDFIQGVFSGDWRKSLGRTKKNSARTLEGTCYNINSSFSLTRWRFKWNDWRFLKLCR